MTANQFARLRPPRGTRSPRWEHSARCRRDRPRNGVRSYSEPWAAEPSQGIESSSVPIPTNHSGWINHRVRHDHPGRHRVRGRRVRSDRDVLLRAITTLTNGADVIGSLNALSAGDGHVDDQPVAALWRQRSLIAVEPGLRGPDDASLQGWSCSVHQSFPTFRTDWSALAVATDTRAPDLRRRPRTGLEACGEAYILIAGIVDRGQLAGHLREPARGDEPGRDEPHRDRQRARGGRDAGGGRAARRLHA